MEEKVTFMKKEYVESLELKELQAASTENGHPTAQIYAELLCCYLLQSKLIEARLLWKRIPATTKTENAELQKLWNIGKSLFVRNIFIVPEEIKEVEWPEYLQEMMRTLAENTRNRVISLISNAYSCISMSDFAQAISCTETETMDKINALGWRVDADRGQKFVYPVKIQTEQTPVLLLDTSMSNLTKYSAFLESN